MSLKKMFHQDIVKTCDCFLLKRGKRSLIIPQIKNLTGKTFLYLVKNCILINVRTVTCVDENKDRNLFAT